MKKKSRAEGNSASVKICKNQLTNKIEEKSEYFFTREQKNFQWKADFTVGLLLIVTFLCKPLFITKDFKQESISRYPEIRHPETFYRIGSDRVHYV